MLASVRTLRVCWLPPRLGLHLGQLPCGETERNRPKVSGRRYGGFSRGLGQQQTGRTMTNSCRTFDQLRRMNYSLLDTDAGIEPANIRNTYRPVDMRNA